MLVIVEGPDGSGKTTLVRKIRERGDGPQFWCMSAAGRYRSAEAANRFCLWLRARPPEVRLLFDRFPLISERVYGPVVRKALWENNLTVPFATDDYDRSLGQRLLQLDLDPIIIYARVPYDDLARTVRLERQMTGVIGNLEALYREYETVMKRLSASMRVIPVNPFNEFETTTTLRRLYDSDQ
jgi:adenylate kinase family enzyme